MAYNKQVNVQDFIKTHLNEQINFVDEIHESFRTRVKIHQTSPFYEILIDKFPENIIEHINEKKNIKFGITSTNILNKAIIYLQVDKKKKYGCIMILDIRKCDFFCDYINNIWENK